MADANITDLLDGLTGKIEEAYQRGLAVGRREERAALLAYLKGSSVEASAPAAQSDPQADEEKRMKAPRGLLATVLKAVLTDRPGLGLPEVELAVMAADSRIAKKSIYNHLNTNRASDGQPGLYRQQQGKWFLADGAPPNIGAPGPESRAPSVEAAVKPVLADASPGWGWNNSGGPR